MSLLDDTGKTIGRARYAAAQSLRSAWYGAHYLAARRRAGGFTRPGEAPFKPTHPLPNSRATQKAFFSLFQQDRLNIEAGLYPPPRDVKLTHLARAMRSSMAFMRDVPDVDARRIARNGVEVRAEASADPKRYPAYYRQNFHYQSGGWFSDDSARIYDTQVEVLFAGSADAMRRAALAEISRELKGRDQRRVRLLDVGAGTGRFLAQTLHAFPKLRATALELSPNYAQTIRKTLAPWAQSDVIEAAAENMPLADKSQDVIVSIYLFHELPPKVRGEVFAEIARVLKPGGVFVFADSLQFDDNPDLNGMLEYFPEGFYEPYYKGYLSADLDGQIAKSGLERMRASTAFLTKVMVWKKP